MPPNNLDRLILRLRSLTHLSDAAASALSLLPYRRIAVDGTADIYTAGEKPPAWFVVLDGCVSRYKRRSDGSRAIVSFELSGDIVNLETLLLDAVDCSARANTPSLLAVIERKALDDRLRAHPDIERALWRAAMIKAASLEEWLLNVGRRTPLARMCHLLAELHVRLDVVGEFAHKLHASPLEIAEAMGLQEVHVERALNTLQEQKVISCSDEGLVILNVDRLFRMGDFRRAYLHLQSHPT